MHWFLLLDFQCMSPLLQSCARHARCKDADGVDTLGHQRSSRAMHCKACFVIWGMCYHGILFTVHINWIHTWKTTTLELGNTKDFYPLFRGIWPFLGTFLNPETAGTELMSEQKAGAAARAAPFFDLPFSRGRRRLSRIPMKHPRNLGLVNVKTFMWTVLCKNLNRLHACVFLAVGW